MLDPAIVWACQIALARGGALLGASAMLVGCAGSTPPAGRVTTPFDATAASDDAPPPAPSSFETANQPIGVMTTDAATEASAEIGQAIGAGNETPDIAAVPPAPPVPTASVPQVPVAASPAVVQGDVDPLRETILNRLRQQPDSAANALDAELLRLLADGSITGPAAVAENAELSSEDQRILSALAAGLGQFRSALRQGESADAAAPPPAAEKIAPLVEMADELNRHIGLTLPTVALCSEVRLFGNYEPMPAPFLASDERAAILYVEVDRFDSAAAPDGLWETKLTLSANLCDADGRPVLALEESPAVDRCRQRRRDFFLCRRLTLPATVPPGHYTLKVSVRDELSGRVAEASIPVEFTATTSSSSSSTAADAASSSAP